MAKNQYPPFPLGVSLMPFSTATATVTALPTLKALHEVGYLVKSRLNDKFNPDSMDYAPLYNALKRLYDGGYEYGYSELLYGLYYGVYTGRISGMAYHHVKELTNKQVFKNIIIPCAKALKKANKNFTSGDAWDWMRDVYFTNLFDK